MNNKDKANNENMNEIGPWPRQNLRGQQWQWDGGGEHDGIGIRGVQLTATSGPLTSAR